MANNNEHSIQNWLYPQKNLKVLLYFIFSASLLTASFVFVGQDIASITFFVFVFLVLSIGELIGQKIIRIEKERAVLIYDKKEYRIVGFYLWSYINSWISFRTAAPVRYQERLYTLSVIVEGEDGKKSWIMDDDFFNKLYCFHSEVADLEKLQKSTKPILFHKSLHKVYKYAKTLSKKLNLPVITDFSNRISFSTPTDFNSALIQKIDEKEIRKETQYKTKAVIKEKDNNLTISWYQNRLSSFLVSLIPCLIFTGISVGVIFEGEYLVAVICILFGMSFLIYGIITLRGHGKNILKINDNEIQYIRTVPYTVVKRMPIENAWAVHVDSSKQMTLYLIGERRVINVPVEDINPYPIVEKIHRHFFNNFVSR